MSDDSNNTALKAIGTSTRADWHSPSPSARQPHRDKDGEALEIPVVACNRGAFIAAARDPENVKGLS